MNENDLIKPFVVFGIVFMIFGLAIIELENKVKDLEKQSEEVHEYILNRIGG